jgi:hypothetical protein
VSDDGIKIQIFGTLFQPNARWKCLCGRPNVVPLGIPLRAVETVYCKRCRKPMKFPIIMSETPRFWGGTKE